MSNLVKQKLWKVSLGMVSAYGTEKDLEILDKNKKLWKDVLKGKFQVSAEILQGIPITSSQMVLSNYKREINSFMQKAFYIADRQDLIAATEGFLKGTKTRHVFDAKRHFLLSLPLNERIEFIESLKNRKDEYNQYSIINQYDKSLPPAGILACDLANYTCMSRFGFFLGYLSENELLANLQKSAILAQENYSSFEEFGFSATVGHLFNMDNLNENFYNYYLVGLERAVCNKNSYWTNLDWNLDLG